ncbi:MAG: hypothetical protein ABI867_02950 [Kofleriaceae bacterium]
MRHHLAIVALLAVSGSAAQAAPKREHKKPVKHVAPVEESDDDDEDSDTVADEEEEEEQAPRRTKRSTHKHEADSEVAARSDDEDADEADAVAPIRVHETADKARPKQWHVAFGPYLWASSVDANISLGPASVSSGVDFFQITRHAKYGAEFLAEARYGRLAIYGDVMYGVVGVDGSKEVGPLMVTLDGTVSSLLVDGNAGFLLTGGDHSLLSVEARAGMRYQRTMIKAAVTVSNAEVSPPKHVDAAADALAGANVVLRPFRRLAFSGGFDLGVFGDSSSTWSASVDASVRVSSHVLLSLGWRTLTTERPNVSIVMHGPRAAVQLVF